MSFGVARDPQRDFNPYDDYRHLAIQARFRRPERLKEKAIELTFIPDLHLEQERRRNDRPPRIGFISLRREAQGILSLPADALPSLLPMLIGEKFKYVVLHGTALRYQQAGVHSFRFEMQINDDEWPPDG
ncbi:hypothetical protein [Microvirga yunnanensis]|uniref:hypothetical protein n=1 Tax=Microvirga yunnanensis TaxID=2953740 RepID=UPI0021CA341D|nr:hypothetical protein [Microvirga sp. HBU65207]